MNLAGFLATFAILFFLAVFAICDVEVSVLLSFLPLFMQQLCYMKMTQDRKIATALQDLRLPRLNAVRRARREAKRL